MCYAGAYACDVLHAPACLQNLHEFVGVVYELDNYSLKPLLSVSKQAWNHCKYRCLQHKCPLENHAPRLSNPFPPKINVDEVENGSGSPCETNTRLCKTSSALSLQLWISIHIIIHTFIFTHLWLLYNIFIYPYIHRNIYPSCWYIHIISLAPEAPLQWRLLAQFIEQGLAGEPGGAPQGSTTTTTTTTTTTK